MYGVRISCPEQYTFLSPTCLRFFFHVSKKSMLSHENDENIWLGKKKKGSTGIRSRGHVPTGDKIHWGQWWIIRDLTIEPIGKIEFWERTFNRALLPGQMQSQEFTISISGSNRIGLSELGSKTQLTIDYFINKNSDPIFCLRKRDIVLYWIRSVQLLHFRFEGFICRIWELAVILSSLVPLVGLIKNTEMWIWPCASVNCHFSR